MEETKINEFKVLLEQFSKLKLYDGKKPTFLEILTKRDTETMWSKLLCFFLNPNNEHGLNDLVLKSFFNVYNNKKDEKKDFNFTDDNRTVETFTEYKYIDIVIKLNNFIIGIENKVNAFLYNDLNDYKEKLEILAKENDIDESQNVQLVVLSKTPVSSEPFTNILYSDLIAEFHKLFPNYYKTANTKYLLFFLDFIENIEKSINMPTIINNSTNFKFFSSNFSKIKELIEFTQAYHFEFAEMVNNIVNKVNNEIQKIKDNKIKISILNSYYDENDGDDTWYLSLNLTNENNDSLCCLRLDISKKNEPFYNLYVNYENDKPNQTNKFKINIPDWKDIKDSLDANIISEYFVNFIKESIKTLNTKNE